LRRDHTETIIRAGVEINSSSHQRVKEEFGRYEVSCSATDRYGNYTCDYDFSGEGPMIAIVYDATTQIAKGVFIQKTGC
jgi:hypothetical protein